MPYSYSDADSNEVQLKTQFNRVIHGVETIENQEMG